MHFIFFITDLCFKEVRNRSGDSGGGVGWGVIIDLLKARLIPLQGTVTLRRTYTPERS